MASRASRARGGSGSRPHCLRSPSQRWRIADTCRALWGRRQCTGNAVMADRPHANPSLPVFPADGPKPYNGTRSQSHLSGDNVGGPPMTSSPQLRPLGELLGTEALGIDLSRPLDEATFAWIGRVFAEHPVLAFRDQNLGAAELAAFGRWFGSPRMHALVKYRHAEYPEVSWLTNVEDDGKVDWYGVKRATDWHTDSTYEADPPILAILHAKEIPSSKGGTMFADMRAAYDALPKTMKDRLS